VEEVRLARGTRDLLPEQASRRNAVLALLREVFARHGFDPLETPAFERIETLTGKYGEEGQKLIFRILKRGEGGEKGEADLALRYDLTVPLARVVAMNPGLRMPFKRWQIAPVWRADRPAKGRFREFWQCDCDIVGTSEILADAECLAVAADALATIGFPSFLVRVNDRRLLRATARAAGVAPEREQALLVVVDKLDKIGRDGVDAELAEKGLGATSRLWDVLSLSGSPAEVLGGLREALPAEPEVEAALADLRELVALADALGVPAEALRIDPTLARGLDYYTGPVFEIEAAEAGVGSLAGGGRYDGLVGVFGKQQVPAVGIALGLERILTVLEDLGRTPPATDRPAVLVAVYDPEHRAHAAAAARAFREAGVRTDLYAGGGKLKAQFKHADAVGVRYVVVVGPGEVGSGTVALKALATGEQLQIPLAEAIRRVAATPSPA
jgi:histidyl-tRNA synthetase